MKKTIRLTENDLEKLVKKVLSEQSNKFVLGTKQRADAGRKRYVEILKSAVRELGTNDANEVINEIPINLLMNIKDETDKLLVIYKQLKKESEEPPR